MAGLITSLLHPRRHWRKKKGSAMYRSRIQFPTKVVEVVAGRDKCLALASYIRAPLNVTAKLREDDFCSEVLFGVAWSWADRPLELHLQYQKELAEYEAALALQYGSRTSTCDLPDNRWYAKYIPTKEEITAAREARKTPEQRAAEKDAADRRAADAAREKAERELRSAECIAKAAELRAAYGFLSQIADQHPVNVCAQNIRRLLGHHWPTVRFSVTLEKFSGGNSINVKWVDGPLHKTVKDLLQGFEEGYFDGMQDMYVDTDTPWHQFGHTKYLNCYRSITNGMRAKAVEILGPTASETELQDWCVNNESIPLETVADTAPESPVDAMIGIGNATISRNTAKDGIEIRFPGKPGPDVLNWLKSHGYRWGFTAKVWYNRYTEDRLREALIRFGIPTPSEHVSA